MTKYISNAFSLQMIDPTEGETLIKIEKVDFFPAGCVSAIGHADTARILGVQMNRINIKLQRGDELYVAQLMGGRLPEGTTKLPDGFKFIFFKVTIV